MVIFMNNAFSKLIFTMFAFMSIPNAFGSDQAETNIQALPIQNYATFIEGIARESSDLVKAQKNETWDELDYSQRQSVFYLFKKMAYATIYSLQYKPESEENIGQFPIDLDKRTPIDDDRIQNILKTCENLAFLMKVGSAPDENIFSGFFLGIEHKYNPPSAREFSYLQRIMLMRIILGYAKKNHAGLNLHTEEINIKNSLSHFLEESLIKPQLADSYWQKTEQATKLIYEKAIGIKTNNVAKVKKLQDKEKKRAGKGETGKPQDYNIQTSTTPTIQGAAVGELDEREKEKETEPFSF